MTLESGQYNKRKPVIWVLHNMPRSGGTLVSKCLGVMGSNVLLSEIHPDAQHALSFNALKQAQNWYGFLPELDWQKTDFVEAIIKIEETTRKSNKHLILRDWSHVDYLGPPVTNTPEKIPKLLDTLALPFEIRSIQLVRHPLDTWLSLRRLNLIKKHKIDFEMFLNAYRCYLNNTSNGIRLVYENFLKSPNQELSQVCEKAGLLFDESYQDKWFSFDKITGDTSNSSSLRDKPLIEFRPRRNTADIDHRWLDNQTDYQFILSEIYR